MMIKKLKQYLRPKLKYILLKIICPYYYKFCAKKEVIDRKVVFIEPQRKELSNSLDVVYKQLQKENKEVLYTEFVNWNNINFVKKVKASIKLLKNIADARIIFIDEHFWVTSAIELRQESKIINLWHGCGAFKKFGFSTADLIFGGSREEQIKYPGYKNTALVTVSSDEVIEHYAEAMVLDKEKIVPVGIARTDVFFDKDYIRNSCREVKNILPQIEGKKVILYAPTFRGRVARAKTPNKLNLELLHYFLKDEYVILIKHHPLVKKRPSIPKEFSAFAIDVTQSLSIDELICVSDICISDYSSLVFEYSLFERPMIFFAYDLEDYYDWRGFYYKYDEFVPGPIVKNNIELLEAIKNVEKYDKRQVIDFKNKFMNACDGRSTERIIKIMRSYMNG